MPVGRLLSMGNSYNTVHHAQLPNQNYFEYINNIRFGLSYKLQLYDLM